MNFELDSEHELIRDMVRDFGAREIAPHAREWDRAEELPRELIDRLGELGFLGAAIPERYGGMGLDMLGYCLLVEELARADSSVRGVVTVNVGLVAKSILRWGDERQRQEWLPRICGGGALGCFALTEPDVGSDAGNLRTSARRDGDGWTISGQKMFITNAGLASVALVFARTGGPGARGVSCFIVPADADGFAVHPIKGKLGLRAQDTGEVVLDGVRVGADALLGGEGDGMKIAMSALDGGRTSLAASCVGTAQACLDASVAYATTRRQFGGPIGGHQLIQGLLADMAVDVQAARLLAWQSAAVADSGRRNTIEASFAKLFASEMAVRVSNSAVQIHGGYGFTDEYPVGKYLRDARVTTLYEGTSEMQRLIVGRHLTGIAAFSAS